MNLEVLDCKSEFLAALWAVATVALYDLARGLQFESSVEKIATLGANYPLGRQSGLRLRYPRIIDTDIKRVREKLVRRSKGKQGLLSSSL